MDYVYNNIIKCCGCSLCEYVCPKDAIKMNTINGFRYPSIDQNLCINCGLCVKKCAFSMDHTQNSNCIEAYAVKHRNNQVIKSSSSGGIFTALSDYILENGGIIVGADYDNNMNLIHKIANAKDSRDRMRGSKYIQSNLSGIYKTLNDYLKNGCLVLFTGTPCQIDAVKKIFGEYDNLYLVDIICHGVPSTSVWNDFTKFIENKYKKKLINYSFRNKDISGWRSYSAKATFDDGTVINNNNTIGSFIELFRYDICLRPSCTQCPYTSKNRVGDITIGDFWGIENILPEISDNNGTSAVMLNTERGIDLFNKIKSNITIYSTTQDDIAKKQPNLFKPSAPSKKSKQFYDDYNNLPFEKVLKKYTRIGIQRRIIDTVKGILGKA